MSPYIFPGVEKRHKHTNLINALTGYVAESHGITVAQIKSDSRKAKIKNPRFICMYMLRTFTDLTLDIIAESYGRKSHGSVLNAVSDVEFQTSLSTAQAKYTANYIKELERKFITSKYLIT